MFVWLVVIGCFDWAVWCALHFICVRCISRAFASCLSAFWRLGACVSRAQAVMGYYHGGAPLVTRERSILSDIP